LGGKGGTKGTILGVSKGFNHFGKFKYNRLPMRLKCSPDFAHEVMKNIFHDTKDAKVYIDEIGTFCNSWEEHMALLCRASSSLAIGQFRKLIG
jgi:hypothetical protein